MSCGRADRRSAGALICESDGAVKGPRSHGDCGPCCSSSRLGSSACAGLRRRWPTTSVEASTRTCRWRCIWPRRRLQWRFPSRSSFCATCEQTCASLNRHWLRHGPSWSPFGCSGSWPGSGSPRRPSREGPARRTFPRCSCGFTAGSDWPWCRPSSGRSGPGWIHSRPSMTSARPPGGAFVFTPGDRSVTRCVCRNGPLLPASHSSSGSSSPTRANASGPSCSPTPR